MSIATQRAASNYLARAPSPGRHADVLLIDAYVRLAAIGIELIILRTRAAPAVDTYRPHFASERKA